MTLFPSEINLLFDSGGLGDSIARLPVLRYLNRTYPKMKVNLFIHDYLIPLTLNFISTEGLDQSLITVYKWSEAKKYYNERLITKSFRHAAFENLSMHMTEHAFAVICNTLVSPQWLNYPKLDLSQVYVKKFKLPKNYVVVTTAFTTLSREFRAEHINDLCQKLRADGKEIVFLGQKATPTGTGFTIEGNFSDEVDYTVGKDLRDRTSLLEAARILADADCVIGLDNGLLHLAACSDVPVIAGFTTVKPEHREPYRGGVKGRNWGSITPPESLECRFCQSQCVFAKGVDFRFCALGTYDCTKLITGEDYFWAVKGILGEI